MLSELRGRGLKTAILTNYVREVQLEKVRFFGLTNAVDAVLCVEDIPAPKPDARAYHTACAALDVAPAEAVMVGDSWLNDVDGALKAGLRAVWFNRAGRPAPVAGGLQIQRLADLIPFIGLMAYT